MKNPNDIHKCERVLRNYFEMPHIHNILSTYLLKGILSFTTLGDKGCWSLLCQSMIGILLNLNKKIYFGTFVTKIDIVILIYEITKKTPQLHFVNDLYIGNKKNSITIVWK